MKTKEYLVVLLLLLILAVFLTFPLAFHLGSRTVAAYGDPLLNTWILAWDHHAIIHSPLNLFQANIIYPSQDVLGYSEHLLTLEVFAFPVLSFTGNPLLAYNLLLFLGLVFAGFAMYLLVRYLTGNRYASFVAAVFFAFCPYKMSKLGHLQICFTVFLPLLLLYLHKFLDSGRTRHLVLFGVFFLAQALASWYLLIFATVAAVLLIAVRLAAEWRAFPWKKLGQLALVGAAVLAVLLPFALPYLRLRGELADFTRSRQEIAMFSAGLGSYFKVLPQSLLYGSAPGILKTQGVGSEFVLFPGVVILLLALLGLLPSHLRRRRRDAGGSGETEAPEEADPVEATAEPVDADEAEPAAPSPVSPMRWATTNKVYYVLLALVGFLFSLGPYGSSGTSRYPSYIFYQLGIFGFIRVPARFSLLVFLALAVLAGFGVVRLGGWVRKRTGNSGRGLWAWRAVGGVVVALLVLDIWVSGLPISAVPVGAGVPAAYSWLKEQPGQVAVDAPFEQLDSSVVSDPALLLQPVNVGAYFAREALSVYYSTYHWKKLVNGYSGYIPYHYVKTVLEMQDFPSERSLTLLRGMGVDYVVWHWDWVVPDAQDALREKLAAASGLEELADFEKETVYGVRDAGARAGAENLAIELAAPSRVAAAETLNVGVRVTNTSSLPFVCMESGQAKVRVTWQPRDGSAARSVEQFGPQLFFLAPSESQSLPLELRAPDTPGEYELSVHSDGSPLGERDLGAVTIAVTPGAAVAGTYSGTLTAGISGAVGQGQAASLLPWSVTVTNGGESTFAAATESGTGAVRIALSWVDAQGRAWGGQHCSIPCDLSPGQSVWVPMLIQLPVGAGRYTLEMQLVQEGVESFGPVLDQEFTVAGLPPG